MFGIGFTEFVLILIVALIAIGPDKLPDVAKMLGKAYRQFKKATDELRSSIAMPDEGDEEAHKHQETVRPKPAPTPETAVKEDTQDKEQGKQA